MFAPALNVEMLILKPKSIFLLELCVYFRWEHISCQTEKPSLRVSNPETFFNDLKFKSFHNLSTHASRMIHGSVFYGLCVQGHGQTRALQ